MSDESSAQSPGPKRGGKKKKDSDRRDFFPEAVREALGPFSGLIEQKINPILAAIDALPGEVDKLANFELPTVLDQPQEHKKVRLPVKVPEPERYWRPPGAMAPGEFEQVCSRCGQCVEACPAEAIKMDIHGLFAEGMPYINATNPCVVCEDLSCMKACPSGALKLVDRLKIKMGTARVDRDLCIRERGEDCRLCVEACPITGDGDAGAGGGLSAIFIHEASGMVRVRKNICVGCGLCESRCPTAPAAVVVVPYVRRDPMIA